MKKTTLPILATAATLAAPALAYARPVSFQVKMKPYGGDGAYLALYVTDKGGAYKGTLWMAGWRTRYYRTLTDWARASGGGAREFDGITGASVGAGKTLTVTVDLADALIDAGFEVHVDTAVEHMREYPSEVVTPLTEAGAGKPVRGRGYVETFTYKLP